MSYKEIQALVEQALQEEGVELVELQVRERGRRGLIRVYVDSEHGITIDRCAHLSRKISDLLDMKDLVAGSYTLEVSSPGADRPLRTERDFKRNIGREVTLSFKNTDGTRSITGTVVSTDADAGTVMVEHDGETTSLTIDSITKAHIKLKW